jgi:GNAT superfamily N-acetyltransferase
MLVRPSRRVRFDMKTVNSQCSARFLRETNELLRGILATLENSKEQGIETQWRGWETLPHMRIYIRVTQHWMGGKKQPTIDLANIEVAERMRGKGLFTILLSKIEKFAKKARRVVYIENVMNRQFADFFRRRGYEEIDTGGLPCFYLS